MKADGNPTNSEAAPGVRGDPFHRPPVAPDRLRLGLILPTWTTTNVRWSEVVEIAVVAEEVGFDSLWVSDHLLLPSEAHLHRVLTTYTDYYNRARPHQGLNQDTPVASAVPPGQGPVRRRDLLGGLLRDYYREAA